MAVAHEMLAQDALDLASMAHSPARLLDLQAATASVRLTALACRALCSGRLMAPWPADRDFQLLHKKKIMQCVGGLESIDWALQQHAFAAGLTGPKFRVPSVGRSLLLGLGLRRLAPWPLSSSASGSSSASEVGITQSSAFPGRLFWAGRLRLHTRAFDSCVLPVEVFVPEGVTCGPQPLSLP